MLHRYIDPLFRLLPNPEIDHPALSLVRSINGARFIQVSPVPPDPFFFSGHVEFL